MLCVARSRSIIVARAPIFFAISIEPSVLPLSETITSPAILCSCTDRCDLATQVPIVSASFKDGITTDNSQVATVSIMLCNATLVELLVPAPAARKISRRIIR